MVEKDNCVTDWLVFRISFFFFFLQLEVTEEANCLFW